MVRAPLEDEAAAADEGVPGDVRFKWAKAFVEYYANLLARANYMHAQGRDAGLKIFDRERHNIQHAMVLAKVS